MIIEVVRHAELETNEKVIFKKCAEILDDIVASMERERVCELYFENHVSITRSEMEELANTLDLLAVSGTGEVY